VRARLRIGACALTTTCTVGLGERVAMSKSTSSSRRPIITRSRAPKISSSVSAKAANSSHSSPSSSADEVSGREEGIMFI
jgi:hypothetical protein